MNATDIIMDARARHAARAPSWALRLLRYLRSEHEGEPGPIVARALLVARPSFEARFADYVGWLQEIARGDVIAPDLLEYRFKRAAQPPIMRTPFDYAVCDLMFAVRRDTGYADDALLALMSDAVDRLTLAEPCWAIDADGVAEALLDEAQARLTGA